MKHLVIEKKIEINASLQKVWRVFTDPIVTRDMGGEYVTDWKVGSSFGWKGLDGNIYTNGTILQIEINKILQHNLFDLNNNRLLSIITYEFTGDESKTTLLTREELKYEMTADQFEEASEGWDFALQAVKETAGKL